MATSSEALKLAQILAPALIGLLGVVVGAVLTIWREIRSEEKKATKDSVYLAAIIGGELDSFVAACADVIDDPKREDSDGHTRSTVATPTFDPKRFDVEWRSIPQDIMLDLLDLPYQINYAEGAIRSAYTYAADPPEYEEGFQERTYQYARLGLHCLNILSRLRHHAKLLPRPKSYDWQPLKKFQGEMLRVEELRKRPTATPGNSQRED